ncbi:hypothetical protein PGT21_021229 [Puccinia graminis f. sp. tritici]|uniref:Uncharacterized protein n=1 Tax=Puccinia graminis f. sp. tritici TaxID=56615 RepID=A0A5B0QR38_PUCGR|nr:hypothetical protein PGT21_021229 [Puccinia graminis f. sp. tritici]KAA1107855.1 hypothetical protein PGTUg99_026967 [Puccinia graminis f. sp. tritici]KAA1115660.1 hypothetical protein PGTUg99_022043 [Puccinia graminis f. sp. tritici]
MRAFSYSSILLFCIMFGSSVGVMECPRCKTGAYIETREKGTTECVMKITCNLGWQHGFSCEATVPLKERRCTQGGCNALISDNTNTAICILRTHHIPRCTLDHIEEGGTRKLSTSEWEELIESLN